MTHKIKPSVPTFKQCWYDVNLYFHLKQPPVLLQHHQSRSPSNPDSKSN